MNLRILIIFVLFSCTSDIDIREKQIGPPTDIKLDGITTFAESLSLGNSISLDIVGNHLVIVDYKCWENCIHLFNRDNLDYLGAVGSTGKGPGDLISPGYIEGKCFFRLGQIIIRTG